MRKITETNRILAKYTAGAATLEETNADLKELGSELRLDPSRNVLTPEEIAATHAETAETACGWGLLDTGTGSHDKVEVKDGKLVDNDVGEMYALLLIGGKAYHVQGDTVTD